MIGHSTAFPDTYARFSTAELLAIFADGPLRLRTTLVGLASRQIRSRPRPEKWSILEIALHLVDAEVMGASRVRLVFAEPGGTFVPYDQDAWAAALRYQQQDDVALDRALRLFDLLRGTTLGIFAAASHADWRKTGTHPELGLLTLRNLLEMYADHSERHIGQILECRRLLGVPLAFPLLLPERLY